MGGVIRFAATDSVVNAPRCAARILGIPLLMLLVGLFWLGGGPDSLPMPLGPEFAQCPRRSSSRLAQALGWHGYTLTAVVYSGTVSRIDSDGAVAIEGALLDCELCGW